MRRMLRVLRDQGVPALATIAFDLVQRQGLVRFLPANPVLDSHYRNLGLFLGVTAAVVASADFGMPGREFGLSALLTTVAAVVAGLLPFLGSRNPAFFRLSPEGFATLSIVAYLALYVGIGILLGGGWTRVVKGVAGPSRADEPGEGP